jgi:nucleotide-binding universal stress UspA family protein
MEAGPIVVGYDGSEPSGKALEWATDEAKARHRPLRIVHVVPDPAGSATGYGIYVPPDPAELVKLGEQTLATATEHVRAMAPTVEVDTRLLVGRQSAAGLLDHLVGAEMAVVGHRGRSGFSELLLGSTGVVLATHARCPVVVVRTVLTGAEPAPEADRVVVGVDGSTTSVDALGFAFEEASLHGRGLTLVHAWLTPFYDVPGPAEPLVDSMVVADFEGDELRLLAESLAGWREKYPDVDVRQVLAHREPLEALVVASTGAHLLVVGTRGRGGFRSLLLGSVSHGVLHHARCPVAIVRPTSD